MKSLSLLLFFTLPARVFAQNYDCFQPTVNVYFTNADGYVRGMRIDSVRTNGSDVIYYPYHTQRISNYLSGASIDTMGGSWFGKKIIKQIDGTFLFDNLWDTVVIKTYAHTGDSWTFFNDTTCYYYIATVTSEDTMTVSGALDSVKTITITADSAGYLHATDPVNDFQIILSKNHGFVQIFDLYTFPYRKPGSAFFCPYTGPYHIRWFDYYLDLLLNNLGAGDLGSSDNPPTIHNSIFHLFAFHNPTLMEIYDFAVGDVYENYYNHTDKSPATFEKYTTDSILVKIEGPYSVTYNGTEHSMSIVSDFSVAPPTKSVTYSSSLYNLTADTSLLIDCSKMPEEWNASYLLHYFAHNTVLCDSPASYQIDYDYKGSAFGDYGNSGIAPSQKYTMYSIGYGISGQSSYFAPAQLTEHQSYSYFNKNSTICGDFTKADKTPVRPAQAVSIRVLPNPANDHVEIIRTDQFATPTVTSIYDPTGRLIFRSPREQQNKITINTSSWSDGLYLAMIQDSDGAIVKKTFVVRH